MKTKQEFITEFLLRTMTNSDVGAILDGKDTAAEDQMLEWAISLANKAWDRLHLVDQQLDSDSENLIAQSEKIIKEAKDVLARIPPDLKAMAQKAVQKSHGAAKWLTIDADGMVNGFDLKPTIYQYSKDMWVAFDPYSELGWLLGEVRPPTDFTKECYRISDILGTE